MHERRGAAAVIIVGLLAAGCGAQVPGSQTPGAQVSGAQTSAAPGNPAVAQARRVNMCTILTGDELTKLSVRLDTRRRFHKLGVVGCRWLGTSYTLSLERDDDTLAGYQTHRNDPKFLNFADNTVNGRAGAHFSVDPHGSHCAQLIDGGPVSLSVSVAVPPLVSPPLDPCAEALRIAQMIEPRLPKAPK